MNKTAALEQETTFSLSAASDLMKMQFCVTQFYFHEAALLDKQQFSDWMELFTDDARYWMPVRRTVLSRDRGKEFTKPGDMAYFDDDKEMLHSRVKKLASPYSWSEDPPSRTRHLVNNVRILRHQDNLLEVESNFHLYRVRFEAEENNWFGYRRDTLLQTDDTFRIKSRKIYLDQTVILATNMSCMF